MRPGPCSGTCDDERVERTGPEVRLYRTRERQDFHTDGADIIGLLCLHSARSGGESKLASSYAVYNEILRRRPDLLEVLYEPMWWDRNGEESPGEPTRFRAADSPRRGRHPAVLLHRLVHPRRATPPRRARG